MAGASTIIKTNGAASTTSQGWALLETGYVQDSAGYYHYTIAGSAVFPLWLPGNPLADASIPLDTGSDTLFAIQFAIPFDHTTGVTGVALTNTYQSTPLTVNVRFTIWAAIRCLRTLCSYPDWGTRRSC